MIKLFSILLICVVGIGCAKTDADKLFINATIYTLDADNNIANSIATRDGKIIYIGDEETSYNHTGENTEIINLEGFTMIPGMTDAHMHIEGVGNSLQTLNLVGTKSVDEIVSKLKKQVAETPPGEWIYGRGWDQNDWEIKKFPTSKSLDDAAPNNPVVFRRIDGHAYWINRTALDIAGIDPKTTDPDGGRIMRLPGTNDPSGILIDNAKDLVDDVVPVMSKETKKRHIVQALHHALALGLTSLHDAGSDTDAVEIFHELAKEGKLVPRVYAMLDDDEKLKKKYFDLGPQIGLYDNHLNIRSVKFYADGALGSRGAALLEPYSDDPENTGLILTPEDSLRLFFSEAKKAGFQINSHAIGDRGNRLILDLVEEFYGSESNSNHRSRLEHAQLISLEDIPRFKKLGVIPSMQPTHCTSDMYWAEDRVGPDRIQGAYAWRKLVDSGSVIPGGSDAPVESLNPLWGIYAAVTRQDHDNYPEEGWYPDERMSIEEAVRMFTSWAAYASFEEDIKGTLEMGKLADFTVLSKNIFEIESSEILNTDILLTVVNGEIYYDNLLEESDILLARK